MRCSRCLISQERPSALPQRPYHPVAVFTLRFRLVFLPKTCRGYRCRFLCPAGPLAHPPACERKVFENLLAKCRSSIPSADNCTYPRAEPQGHIFPNAHTRIILHSSWLLRVSPTGLPNLCHASLCLPWTRQQEFCHPCR